MTENLLQLPKSATNRRLPEFLLSHHRSRSGSRSRSVTGNTLRRGRQKRKEKKRKLFVFIFWRQKQKRIFRNSKVFWIHEIFCVNAPAQKGNFPKGYKYVSSFFSLFFFFFLNQSSMSFLRHCLSHARTACPRRGLMGRRERVRKEECIEARKQRQHNT